MKKLSLFQYAVLFHPTEKQIKDEGKKSIVIVEPKTVLSTDERGALMSASMEIPTEYKDKLEQVEIAIRPF